MNIRQKKKQKTIFIKELTRLNLSPEEILVFYFDPKTYRPESMDRFNEYVKKNISNKIIFIPKEFEMIVLKDKS